MRARRNPPPPLSPLASVLFVALFVVHAAHAEERPIIEITPGQERAFHVAVQSFRDDLLPAVPKRAEALRDAVEAGLEFNGVLLPLAREAFLGEAVGDAFGSLKSGGQLLTRRAGYGAHICGGKLFVVRDPRAGVPLVRGSQYHGFAFPFQVEADRRG